LKITKTQLRQIIKEEISSQLGPEDGPVKGGEVKTLNPDTMASLRDKEKSRPGSGMRLMDYKDNRKYDLPQRVEAAGFILVSGSPQSEKPNGVVARGIYDDHAYFGITGAYKKYLILPLEQ